MTAARRIAMWSGPRNISTALLRAWGQRPDTIVCDEPLYAHYLKATDLPHPGRDEILEAHEADWRRVVAWLTGPLPAGKTVFYQKHMAHHLLPAIDRGWLDGLTHVLLIRDPREMLTSLVKIIPDPTVEDTGLPQQLELFDRLAEQTGQAPPVIDARDVLSHPEGLLRALCDAVAVPFTPVMLSWPAGGRDTDGVWAKHWYAAVNESTGFQPYRPKSDPVPDGLSSVLHECDILYSRLYANRLAA